MTTYNIKKSYEGFPSKTNNSYETNLSLEEAQNSLNHIASMWTRNGGEIISHTNDTLIVEEGDGSNTITFEIIEN